jgi:hypothetical protein
MIIRRITSSAENSEVTTPMLNVTAKPLTGPAPNQRAIPYYHRVYRTPIVPCAIPPNLTNGCRIDLLLTCLQHRTGSGHLDSTVQHIAGQGDRFPTVLDDPHHRDVMLREGDVPSVQNFHPEALAVEALRLQQLPA